MTLLILVKTQHRKYTNIWKSNKLASITTEPKLGERLLKAKGDSEKIIVFNPDLGISFHSEVANAKNLEFLWQVEFNTTSQTSCEKPQIELVQGTIGAEFEGIKILKTY